MRESIGSTWVMQLMFGFILLFVSFLAITISYSKSFRIKNEITSIMEKYGGYNNSSHQIIRNYVKSLGYTNKGICYDSKDAVNGIQTFGIDNLDNGLPDPVNSTKASKRYYYCVKKMSVKQNAVSNIYYEVTTFYKFNLPILGDISTFSVKGKTTDLTDYKGYDCFDSGSCT